MSSGGGGKGGTTNTTQSVEIDPRLAEGSANAIAGALSSAGLDYSPNRGESIAAFSPQQMAAFKGANDAAGAYGLPTGGGTNLVQPTTNAMGIQGYSTGSIFDQMRDLSVSPEQQAERQSILDYYSRSGNLLAGQTEAGGFGEAKGTSPTTGAATSVASARTSGSDRDSSNRTSEIVAANTARQAREKLDDGMRDGSAIY